jgi:nitrate reductase cytochrome c-type subunit
LKRLPFVVLVLASTALAQGPTPPPIPHSIDGYTVKRQENDCLECHDRPREIGKKRTKGLSPPMPRSHYAKLEGKPEIAGVHFVCTSCHARK